MYCTCSKCTRLFFSFCLQKKTNAGIGYLPPMIHPSGRIYEQRWYIYINTERCFHLSSTLGREQTARQRIHTYWHCATVMLLLFLFFFQSLFFFYLAMWFGDFFCYFYFFSIPFIIFALLFCLPPSRNSDPGSHSRLFSPPTHYGSCLAFFSRKISADSSLVDSRRIATVD